MLCSDTFQRRDNSLGRSLNERCLCDKERKKNKIKFIMLTDIWSCQAKQIKALIFYQYPLKIKYLPFIVSYNHVQYSALSQHRLILKTFLKKLNINFLSQDGNSSLCLKPRYLREAEVRGCWFEANLSKKKLVRHYYAK